MNFKSYVRQLIAKVRDGFGCGGGEATTFSDSEEDVEEEQKLVEINLLREDLNAARKFPRNSMHTARYTIVTALPLSLLYQFRKVSNIYFLLVMIISLIPGASPINPFSSVAPLCVVLGAGVIKDLWEDWKRRTADRIANDMKVQVLRDGDFTDIRSSDVRPGDVLLLRLGEEVRADCLILNTALPDGLTYIETANLDGETNAKTRRASAQTTEYLGTVEAIVELALADRSPTSAAVPPPHTSVPVVSPHADCGLFDCGAAQSRATSEMSPRSGTPLGKAAPVNGCPLAEGTEVASPNDSVVAFTRAIRHEVPSQQPAVPAREEAESAMPVSSAFVSPARLSSRTQQVQRRTLSYSNNWRTSPPEGQRHVRYRTFDERLAAAGALPVPPEQANLTRLYEQAHSRTASTQTVPQLSSVFLPPVDLSKHDAAAKDITSVRSGSAKDTTADAAALHPGVVMLGSAPNPDLSSWFGQVRLPTGLMIAVGIEQFLPRGCIVRNTDWVLAAVLYTGRHTKMLLNLKPKPVKMTNMTRRLNQLNIGLFIFNQLMMFLLCGLALYYRKKFLHRPMEMRTAFTAWYIQWSVERHSYATLFWWRYLTNFVLLSYLIPMSLYVTLEFNKAMQMLLIAADKRMAVFDEFSNTLKKSRPKTSELNCQLGQVGYIFTDKTGTLTENLMTYVGGYVAGLNHDERLNPGGLGKMFLLQLFHSRRALQRERSTAILNATNAQQADLDDSSTSSADGHLSGRSSRTNVPRVEPSRSFGVPHRTKAAPALPQTLSIANLLGDSYVSEAKLGETPGATPTPTSTRLGLTLAEEAALESDDLYCYLRALSLCHTVVCFSVDEEGGEEGEQEAMGKDSSAPRRQKQLKAEERQRKPHQHHQPTLSSPSRIKTAEPPQSTPRSELSITPTKRVYVPNAVPAGPPAQSLSPTLGRRSETGVERANTGRSTDRGPSVDMLAAAAATSPDARQRSQLAPHERTLSRSISGIALHRATLSGGGLATDVAPNSVHHGRSLSTSQQLHGRTNSASWYYNRYNTNTIHQRTATVLSNEASLIEHIDRSKLYEGQSLDEIALVSAARENAFSLYQRTAKQMFIKVVDQVMCYDIIAELHFSPQRKLMSILLQRNPACDTEAAASSMQTKQQHYHRSSPDDSHHTMSSRCSSPKDSQLLIPRPARARHEPFVPTTLSVTDISQGRSDTNIALTEVSPPHRADTQIFNHEAPQQRREPVPSEHEGSSSRRAAKRSRPSSVAGSPSTSASPHAKPYLLLVKGADSSMLGIVNMRKQKNIDMKPEVMTQLDTMARTGLRTLVLGQRRLSEQEVRQWLPIFSEAQCSMHARSERLHEAYALMERDIDLVGTTAVEDRLQDAVPETLNFFIEASIVVWMLTGDKRETAVTIARTSGLVNQEYSNDVFHLDVADALAEVMARQEAKRVQRSRAAARAGQPVRLQSPISVQPDHSTSAEEQTKGYHRGGGVDPSHHSGADEETPGDGTTDDDNADADEAGSNINDDDGMAEVLARLDAQFASAEQMCAEGLREHGFRTAVMVVDGRTLDLLFSDNASAHRFFLLGSQCRSAVCCRMTPLQKAQIVRMFQKNMKAVALAIGDGANDVSMIQEGKIGIGIMGLEGSQAELASDYAIPKFRFLKRLLMVHGRFSIYREAHCILYSLYKNIVLTVGMMGYSFYCAHSGMTFVDSWLLAMFSIFFCSLQPLVIGILDKDVEDELAESMPQLYPPLACENMYFSIPYIMKWLLDGVVEGCFFFFFLIYTIAIKEDLYGSKPGAIEDYGEVFFTMLVLIADIRVGAMVTYYTVVLFVVITLEIALLPTIELFYSQLHQLGGTNWSVYTAVSLYGAGKFYIFLFFAFGVFVVYTVASNLYVQMFAPWQNAGLAMHAARASPYRDMHHREKKELLAEYKQRLAVQQALEESEAASPTELSAHSSPHNANKIPSTATESCERAG